MKSIKINSVTLPQFCKLLKKYTRVFMYFYLPTCPYCKAAWPRIQNTILRAKLPEKTYFFKINVNNNESIRKKLQINGVPRIIYCEEKKLLADAKGNTKQYYSQFVKSIKAIQEGNLPSLEDEGDGRILCSLPRRRSQSLNRRYSRRSRSKRPPPPPRPVSPAKNAQPQRNLAPSA